MIWHVTFETIPVLMRY